MTPVMIRRAGSPVMRPIHARKISMTPATVWTFSVPRNGHERMAPIISAIDERIMYMTTGIATATSSGLRPPPLSAG
ncbi:MAG: hypothetical protein A4E39_01218 [Methanoregulaceae archaeon PtaB.Bin152]|nr:MAG: hypothetical protein A4E39_01218 [Methanoregulaceae archaeon PtaB.Bin152]